MPRKVFVAGEILTAADLQANAVDQSVMTFASSAARGSAIPSPTEGMVTYLNDANGVFVYDGSAWKQVLNTTGGILQVVSTSKTDTFSTSSTSYTQVTGMSATITPISSSSKIIVLGQFTVSDGNNTNRLGHWKITRGGTDFYIGDTAGSRTRGVFGGDGPADNTSSTTSHSINAVDSPATTTATTYRLECRANNGTVFLNRALTDTDGAGTSRGASSIILMEVAG